LKIRKFSKFLQTFHSIAHPDAFEDKRANFSCLIQSCLDSHVLNRTKAFWRSQDQALVFIFIPLKSKCFSEIF